MGTPLKLKDANGNFQEMTTSEENYLAYQIGIHLSLGDSAEEGALSKLGDTSVGTFTNTFFNEPVGTHPGTSITSGSTTFNLYQRTGTAAETDSDWTRPMEWVDSAGETGFKEMDDTSLNEAVDRYLSTIFTNDYPGTYKVGTSSPGAGYGLVHSNVFTDTRTDGTSTQYNLYQRTSYTAPAAVIPTTIKTTSPIAIQGMTERQIRQTFGQRAKTRINASKIGTYQIRSATQGAPTDPGTWVSAGAVTDTKQQTADQVYTRDSTSQFQTTYTRQFQNQYQVPFTRIRQDTTFERNYTRLYANTYTSNFTRLAAESFDVNYIGTFETTYVGTYERIYTGTYNKQYVRAYDFRYEGPNFTQDYTRLFARNYTPNYTRLYLGDYTKEYTSNYTNTYTRAYNLSLFYVADYLRQGNFDTTYTEPYNKQYLSGPYSRNFTGPESVLFYTPNYDRNYTSGPYDRAFAANYTGNYTGDTTPAYQRTFQTNYTLTYVGGPYTHGYSRVYAGTYTNFVSPVYVGNYIRNYVGGPYTQGPYTRNYTRNYDLIYTRNYTGYYIRDFVGAFENNYLKIYSGLEQFSSVSAPFDVAYLRDLPQYTGFQTVNIGEGYGPTFAGYAGPQGPGFPTYNRVITINAPAVYMNTIFGTYYTRDYANEVPQIYVNNNDALADPYSPTGGDYQRTVSFTSYYALGGLANGGGILNLWVVGYYSMNGIGDLGVAPFNTGGFAGSYQPSYIGDTGGEYASGINYTGPGVFQGGNYVGPNPGEQNYLGNPSNYTRNVPVAFTGAILYARDYIADYQRTISTYEGSYVGPAYTGSTTLAYASPNTTQYLGIGFYNTTQTQFSPGNFRPSYLGLNIGATYLAGGGMVYTGSEFFDGVQKGLRDPIIILYENYMDANTFVGVLQPPTYFSGSARLGYYAGPGRPVAFGTLSAPNITVGYGKGRYQAGPYVPDGVPQITFNAHYGSAPTGYYEIGYTGPNVVYVALDARPEPQYIGPIFYEGAAANIDYVNTAVTEYYTGPAPGFQTYVGPGSTFFSGTYQRIFQVFQIFTRPFARNYDRAVTYTGAPALTYQSDGYIGPRPPTGYQATFLGIAGYNRGVNFFIGPGEFQEPGSAMVYTGAGDVIYAAGTVPTGFLTFYVTGSSYTRTEQRRIYGTEYIGAEYENFYSRNYTRAFASGTPEAIQYVRRFNAAYLSDQSTALQYSSNTFTADYTINYTTTDPTYFETNFIGYYIRAFSPASPNYDAAQYLRDYIRNYTGFLATNYIQDAYQTDYIRDVNTPTGYLKTYDNTTTTQDVGYNRSAGFPAGISISYLGPAQLFAAVYSRTYTSVPDPQVNYDIDYVGTYTTTYNIDDTFTRPYTNFVSYIRNFDIQYVRVDTIDYQGNYDRTFTGLPYVTDYQGNYINQYTGSYDTDYNKAYTTIYTDPYTGTFETNYVGTFETTYAGTYEGIYTSVYEGAFVGNYDITYVGTYTANYTSVYTGTYTTDYQGDYLTDYTGNFQGDFSGLTIQATNEDNEIYTLYVRIA